jgi:hypothetical protein
MVIKKYWHLKVDERLLTGPCVLRNDKTAAPEQTTNSHSKANDRNHNILEDY